jgi:hypothetical protein
MTPRKGYFEESVYLMMNLEAEIYTRVSLGQLALTDNVYM